MLWKLLIIVLTLDFLYRICRYGKLEVQHFRNKFCKTCGSHIVTPELQSQIKDALQSNKEKEK